MISHHVRKMFNRDEMSTKPRVQHMSWKQKMHHDDDINRPKPKVLHPPSHKEENILAQPSTSNEVAVKDIVMGGDVM